MLFLIACWGVLSLVIIYKIYYTFLLVLTGLIHNLYPLYISLLGIV